MEREKIVNILKQVWGAEWDTLKEKQKEKHIKDFEKRHKQYEATDKASKDINIVDQVA